MIDRSAVDRMLAANRYLVLGTADKDGQPWVTPAFFAPVDPNRLCWVSSPDSRHSRNITHRAAVRHRYVLIRGGNPEFGNAVDMRVEV